MYMVLISINPYKLEKRSDYLDICESVKSIMINNGFTWRGGPLYVGHEGGVNAVDCVLIIQKIVAKLPHIKDLFSDIQMIRVEEMTDLFPAIERCTSTFK